MARIGIIGCGNMGTAIIKAAYSVQRIAYSFDKDMKKNAHIAKQYKTRIASSSADLAKSCDVVILAVKPRDIETVLHEIKDKLDNSKILVSIAAGVTTRFIEQKIGKKIPVIRVMPNMPALVGAGISAICKGRFAEKRDLVIVKKIFMNLGEVVEIGERLFNAVTVISGSGPAYFFYLAEVLIKAGIGLGLKKETAQKLAVETALGSARILKKADESAKTLRAKVTSKGGTTEAAFKEFFKRNLEGILKSGIKKAFKRAQTLNLKHI